MGLYENIGKINKDKKGRHLRLFVIGDIQYSNDKQGGVQKWRDNIHNKATILAKAVIIQDKAIIMAMALIILAKVITMGTVATIQGMVITMGMVVTIQDMAIIMGTALTFQGMVITMGMADTIPATENLRTRN
ncbi:hypothetical protein ABES03_22640 [Neobacillus rhizosphaerae]|uniref:hypothetical protein n=1 Tax=Neobacillus rhizosphaerae TaxID=2880965 RepID=UPI003D2A3D2E